MDLLDNSLSGFSFRQPGISAFPVAKQLYDVIFLSACDDGIRVLINGSKVVHHFTPYVGRSVLDIHLSAVSGGCVWSGYSQNPPL